MIEHKVSTALEQGWASFETGVEPKVSLPPEIGLAATKLVDFDSAPDRGMILAIVAGTAVDPEADPSSLQASSGVDRRGQASDVVHALTKFKKAHSLTLKISRDPGVSNPWREPTIDAEWLTRRKRLPSAPMFLELVTWLSDVDGKDRANRADQLLQFLAYRIVTLAAGNQIIYPQFATTPKLAMQFVTQLLATVADRPDALEAVVCAATRAVAGHMQGDVRVERRDTNSPDPIDIVITRGDVKTGIEVTDLPIEPQKLEHEVRAAMLTENLEQATVVSRPPKSEHRDIIDQVVVDTFHRFGKRIDLLTVDDIESWLTVPGLPPNVATTFVQMVGPEMDQYSAIGTRRAWFEVLNEYVTAVNVTSTD